MPPLRVLVTSTSFQDVPGPHHEALAREGFEVERARGPLDEDAMLALVGPFDGILCGDDAFTRAVLRKALPRLRVLSKYGVGTDRIDLAAAAELGIPVGYCPGGNHVAVAELAIGLMVAVVRSIPREDALVKRGEWTRLPGRELAGKTLGILGLGRIGKEVARRAAAFDMKVCAHDVCWDESFAAQAGVERKASAEEVLRAADVLSLNMSLTDGTRGFLDAARLAMLKPGAYVVNCARGAMVVQADVAAALRSGRLAGYAADVADPEPVTKDNPLLQAPNVILTPHIGSRTVESVERQAMMAVRNLVGGLKGEPLAAQANRAAD
jgi:D-3-phosphoglycerate dehydrogenase